MDIIRVENLKKSYGDIAAVRDVSFVVKQGELFAFLGLNGAGKSTTINIISGSLEKDSGKVYIDGEDLDIKQNGIKSKTGIVFQNSVLDKVLSVKDNLLLRAGLYGMTGREAEARVNELSGLLNLNDLLKRKVKTLSGGQRRRVDVARALIHDPKILIMDEPTTGLDPQTRNLLWDVMNTLRRGGLTIFLTTHYMEEAAGADYVIIIDDGKIAVKGTPLELKRSHTTDVLKIYTEDKGLYGYFSDLGYAVSKSADGLHIAIGSTSQAKEIIKDHGEHFDEFEVLKGDMNNVFLNVTGKSLREN